MRTEETMVGPCRLRLLKADTESVVSWHGSFVTYPDVARGERALQALVTALLDKGTERRDRFAIAEGLANCGARAGFASNSMRVALQGRALRADIPYVFSVLAEMLRLPLFAEAECAKEVVKLGAAIEQAMENTSAQAIGALCRGLFSRANLYYEAKSEDLLSWLKAVTPEQIRAFYARHYGSREMVLAFAGDLDRDAILAAVEDAFGDWPGHDVPASHRVEAPPRAPAVVRVQVPDKRSLDVRLGHAVALFRSDRAYLPLVLANHILGGDFSARLMRTVRDEMGLTYGIYSRLAGFSPGVHGYWVVGVTLSQELLGRGLEATRAEIRRFVEEGPSEEEVRRSKTTICGAYKVGLATSGSLASTLHGHAIHGLPADYMEAFPAEIQRVTHREVKQAIRDHFQPDKLHVAIAGEMA